MVVDLRAIARDRRLLVGCVALLVLTLAAALPVPDARAALVLRFDQPVRVISGGGLAWRAPLIERVVWLDRRWQTLTADATPITGADGQPLAVDAYATWRVTDPLRFYQALGAPEHAAAALRAMLAAVVQQQPGGAANETALRSAFARELAPYGAALADLRLSRVVPSEGAAIDAVYARMTAGAGDEAGVIAAQGHRDALLIRADAQSRAAAIEAASFGKDPQFHDFYRAMQSYDVTFAQKAAKTTIVLSPDNAWLRQFHGH